MIIQQICQSITNFLHNTREAFPQMPKLLLVSSMMERPGLSVITSTSNITKDLQQLGIPIGQMPDGSQNLTVGFAFASTKEIYRGIREDMSLQVGIQPGTLDIMAGTLPGKNITPGVGVGAAY